MYAKLDNYFKVFVANKHSDVLFYPSDFSIVNNTHIKEDAIYLSKNLFNTPSDRHVLLLLTRSRRKNRIDAISNIQYFRQWNFLDSVNIIYEKASSCSNNGFLPLSESGNILYKGVKPDVSTTAWFNDDKKNASNLWDLGIHENEVNFTTACYHNKVSWELLLLMYSLSNPLIYRDFIYSGFKLLANEAKSIIHFCKHMHVSCQIVFSTEEEADKFINIYKELK